MTNAHTTDRWKDEQRTKALRQEPIVQVFARRRHADWLRGVLKTLGVRYRDWTIGKDVRVVTTDLTTCPCCKQAIALKEETP